MGKAFEKQTKTIKDQGEKQLNALESLKLKEVEPEETKSIEYDNYFINGLAEIRDATNAIKNIKNLYESREKVVQLLSNYAKNMSKNIYKY